MTTPFRNHRKGLNGTGRGRAILPALALLSVLAPAACGQTCGGTITSDTTLSANLNCPGNGLTITASNITLDLSSFNINGPGTVGSVGVQAAPGITGVTIMAAGGGAIQNFSVGIQTGAGFTVQGVTFVGDLTGMQIGANNRIINNTLTGTGSAGTGVDIRFSALIQKIKGNTISGFATGIGGGVSDAVTIAENQIVGNNVGVSIGGGQALSICCNRVYGNQTVGIEVRNAGSGTIEDNQVSANETGMKLDGVRQFVAQDNTVDANSQYGIVIVNVTFPNTLTKILDNEVLYNGSFDLFWDGLGPGRSCWKYNTIFSSTPVTLPSAGC